MASSESRDDNSRPGVSKGTVPCPARRSRRSAASPDGKMRRPTRTFNVRYWHATPVRLGRAVFCDSNISESPTATHASHSRAHVVRSCRSALPPYLRGPLVGLASAAFSRFAPRAPCARSMHGKTQQVRHGVRASVTKISQNERVRVRVDLA